MTLVYVSSCEVARAILLQLPLHPCKSNDNIGLILQKLCLYILEAIKISDIGQTEF